MKRKIALILVALLVLSCFAYAAGATKTIAVVANGIRLMVNQQPITVENFLYNGTTYVPLRAVSEALGATVSWDGKTNTASIALEATGSTSGSTASATILKNSVDAFDPIIDLTQAGIASFDALALTCNGQKQAVSFTQMGTKIKLFNENSLIYGNVLQLNKDYVLTLYNGTQTKSIQFKSGGLRPIVQGQDASLYYVPAMPEKGFNWAFWLRIPSNYYANEAVKKIGKSYLFIEGINNGPCYSRTEFNTTLGPLRTQLQNGAFYGVDMSQPLNLPYMMPIIPRLHIGYDTTFGGQVSTNYLYTHQMDRDTVILDQLLAHPTIGPDLKSKFSAAGYDANDFVNLDEQVIKMAEQARIYLGDNGIAVESKYFIGGFSASGGFADQMVALHPQSFKAYVGGSTGLQPFLPAAEYKGNKLIAGIGAYDYAQITGKPFDLSAFNNVARVLHRGSQDMNDTLNYSDCYGEDMRQIIKSFLSGNTVQRTAQITKVFGEVGGKGLFIIDGGESHSMSQVFRDYTVEFFKANMLSDTPAYPLPKAANLTNYTLFQ